jgi:hypothetical protein
MVLNLLYTRTLGEARAFLDRSFARYLGSIGSQVGGWVGGWAGGCLLGWALGSPRKVVLGGRTERGICRFGALTS